LRRNCTEQIDESRYNQSNVKVALYIPIADNDGRDLESEIEDLELALYIEFVGWTKHGLVNGTYQMPDGSRSDDVHRVYSVFMNESRLPELEQILRSFKDRTTQDAIYVEIQRNVEVRLIK